ncbi:acyltransferase family protein [Paractinoplanes durhamensis]|nr:acyltransferase [Actinoplanes durhamensis]
MTITNPPLRSAEAVAPAAPGTAPAPRMAWLDALRGFAALVVAWYHISPSVIGHLHFSIHHYVDLGRYGVMLFFLVSGYVIPMSLERHGSPRKFWVGRLFRIYPAFLATVVVALVLVQAGLMDLPPALREQTVAGTLGHVTMLQEFVGVRGLLWPFWTLSFEMVFYLVVAGLFVWGLHRLSAWWAAGLALIALLGGPALPDALFGATAADRRLTAAVLVLVMGFSLIAYLNGRRALVAVAGVLGLGFVMLPLFNAHTTRWSTSVASWQAVVMLSIMFAGTVIYRLQHGQINRAGGFAALGAVFVASAVSPWVDSGDRFDLVRWTLITGLVAGTFALGFALRHRRVPALLTWLGAISYSVYLMHYAALMVAGRLVGEPHPTPLVQAKVGIVFAVLTFGAAWLTYRFVEQPGQALGRRFQRYLDERLGPDRSRRQTTPTGSR